MGIQDDFFYQPTLDLAKQLLGMELVHQTEHEELSGKIVEVEAYKGPEDKAAHSFGGRRTNRTEIMYGKPGHVYMFLIYGMHHCFNIVTGPVDKPEAILIRALEPITGIDEMLENRYGLRSEYTRSQIRNLTNGPGKLCKALGMTMSHYGLSLNDSIVGVRAPHPHLNGEEIVARPRVNIDYAEEHAALPWRFSIKNNPFVSK